MKALLNSTLFQLFAVFFITATLLSLSVRVNDSYGIINDRGEYVGIVMLMCGIGYGVVLAKYDTGKTILNHLPRLIARFVLLTFFPGMIAFQNHDLSALTLALPAFASFYIIFELEYNWGRNHDPFYVGTVALNDRIVNWLNTNGLKSIFPAWYVALKILLLLGAVFINLHYYLKH